MNEQRKAERVGGWSSSSKSDVSWQQVRFPTCCFGAFCCWWCCCFVLLFCLFVFSNCCSTFSITGVMCEDRPQGSEGRHAADDLRLTRVLAGVKAGGWGGARSRRRESRPRAVQGRRSKVSCAPNDAQRDFLIHCVPSLRAF